MVSPERRSASTVLLVGDDPGAVRVQQRRRRPTAVDAAGKPSRTKCRTAGSSGRASTPTLLRSPPTASPATVLVARQGKILLNKGYGMAIRSDDIANAAESVIGIGSITKQFTAAGILKLEMQGKLSTEDMLPKYFDRVPGSEARHHAASTAHPHRGLDRLHGRLGRGGGLRSSTARRDDPGGSRCTAAIGSG